MNTTALSALSFEVDTVSTEAHLLPATDFTVDDGRGALGMDDSFKMSAVIAANVVDRFARKQNDTVIDYEHQSLLSAVNGKEAPAAGWFKTIEYRDTGLWATNIKWTAKAKAYLANKEYRYISAVFSYDKETGEIVSLVNFTLTNTPAKDGLQALAGLSHQFDANLTNPLGELDMAGNETTSLTVEHAGKKNVVNATDVAALMAERDTLNQSVAALTAERDTAKAEADALKKEKVEQAAATEKKAHADLLQTALSDGRLAPSQKAWAEKQTLAALTEYLDVTKPLVDGKRQAEFKEGDADENGLTAEELAMCSSMQIDPKEFAATKAGKPLPAKA